MFSSTLPFVGSSIWCRLWRIIKQSV